MDKLSGFLERPVVGSLLYIAGTIFVVMTLMYLVRRLIRRRVENVDIRYRAAKLASLAGYVVVMLVVATEIAGQFSGLTVAIGAASAGIAFALQEVIASFAGWLAISFAHFYHVGDRIQLGGIRGDVIDVGFLRTTLMECGGWVDGDLYNGRIVRVANSFVFKEPVYNYSGEFPFLWDELKIPIKYGSDYDLARTLLEEVVAAETGAYSAAARERWAEFVRSYRLENARIDPMVTLVANDNWVEFTVRYVVDFRARRLTKDALFVAILRRLRDTGGRVDLGSATFHLVEAAPLRVVVRGGLDPVPPFGKREREPPPVDAQADVEARVSPDGHGPHAIR